MAKKTSETIEFLTRFAQQMDKEVLTKEDFSKVVQRISEFLAKKERENAALLKKVVDLIEDRSTETNTGLIDSLESKIAKEVRQITKESQKAIKEQQDGLNFMRDFVRGIKNGKDADEDSMMERLNQVISDVPKTTAEDTRDRLEALRGEERLNIKAIDGLEELLEGLRSDTKKLGGRPQGNGSVAPVENTSILDVAETPDGAITTFSIAQKPQFVVINGVQYRESNGWEWVSNQVETDFAPPTDSDVYGTL